MNDISFRTSSADRNMIARIVDRASGLGLITRDYDRITATMDITATHANGTPLRLADLHAADDFNFMHDIVGIARHIDRDTGTLSDHFRPRFSA